MGPVHARSHLARAAPRPEQVRAVRGRDAPVVRARFVGCERRGYPRAEAAAVRRRRSAGNSRVLRPTGAAPSDRGIRGGCDKAGERRVDRRGGSVRGGGGASRDGSERVRQRRRRDGSVPKGVGGQPAGQQRPAREEVIRPGLPNRERTRERENERERERERD